VELVCERFGRHVRAAAPVVELFKARWSMPAGQGTLASLNRSVLYCDQIMQRPVGDIQSLIEYRLLRLL
jgi:hypothetical protein